MEEIQNAMNEATIPQEAEGQQEEVNEKGTDSQPQEGADNLETPAQSGEEGGTTGEDIEEAPYLDVKFKKEIKGLSKDEARTWAQKGMHYESALERAAALKGVPVNDFLKSLEAAEDEAYRQSIIEKYGNDEEIISDMMAIYESKKQKTIETAAENRRKEAEEKESSLNERIANEFSLMKKDFPELTEFSKLPNEVKKAASEGMPLAYAYLLHQHTESQKIATAKQQAAEAEKHSAGALGSADTPDMVGDAFSKGVFG